MRGLTVILEKKNEGELQKLAGEIDWYEEQARKTVMLALQYKLEIGRRLARAKRLLPHGKFLAWAHNEFGWTPRHVQRHVTLAENATRVSSLPPDTSLRMALLAIKELRVDPEKRAAEAPGKDCAFQQIHILGELEKGTIDRDRLLSGVAKLAEELGVQKARWRIR